MSFRIAPGCDGCGICSRACPRGAISFTLHDTTPLAVTALECNDCAKCAVVCPLGIIEPDPAWAVCLGRGCPLISKRYEGWACTEGRTRCACGNPLWKSPETREWRCVKCDLGGKAACPKARRAAVQASSSSSEMADTAGPAR